MFSGSISHHHYKNNAPQTRCFFFVVRGEITASSRVRHEMPWSCNHLVRHRASDEHEGFAFTQNRRAIHLPPPLQKQRTSNEVLFFVVRGEITASSRVRHEMPWSRNHLVRHRASDEHEDFAFTQNRRAIHLPPPLQKQRTSPGVAFFCGTGGDHGFQPCKAWFVSYFRLIDGDCSVRGIMPEKVAVLRILPGIC